MNRTFLVAWVLALAFITPGLISSGTESSIGYPIVEEEAPSELSEFLDALGFQESGNRYWVVNRYGYMGRYQFGRATLQGLGYNVTRREFLDSPELQEEAMVKLLEHNKFVLRNYIKHYDGKKVHGVKVTESGLLAAAHLVGPAKVKEFLRTGTIAKDGNGTSLTSYMKRFGGYELNLEV